MSLTYLEMSTSPLTIKQESDYVPEDFESLLDPKIEIKEEIWHQDFTPQSAGSILQDFLKQNVSKLSTQQSTPVALPEPPPLIFFSEKKRHEILSSQHEKPPVSFRPPIPPLSEPPPLVFFSQVKRDAAILSPRLDAPQNAREPQKHSDNRKMHHCLHCDFETTSSTALHWHCVQTHPSSGFECDQCKMVFPTYRRLRRHLTAHQRDKSVIYFCSVCNYSTHCHNTLRSHETRKHRSSKLECDYCKRLFSLKSKLEQHIVMHIKDPQMCTICGRWYKNRNTLDRHNWLHHRRKPLACDYPGCSKSYVYSVSLEKHRMKHTGDNLSSRDPPLLRCEHCGAEFAKKSQLNVHVRREHLRASKSGRQRYLYQCDYCQKMLPGKVALRQHISHEHLQNVRLYHCPYCDFTATHRSGVCLHKARKHRSHNFECDHCKKMFPIKQDLLVHITNNHNIVLQACKICGSQYKNRTILKYHHTIKHADKPFEDERQSGKSRTLRGSKPKTVEAKVKSLVSTRKALRSRQKIPIVPANMNPVVLLTRVALPLKNSRELEYVNLKNSPPPSGDIECHSAFIKEEIQQEDTVTSAEFDVLPPSPSNLELPIGSTEEKILPEDRVRRSPMLSDLEIALQMAVNSFMLKQKDTEVHPTVKQEFETPITALKIKQEPLDVPSSTEIEQNYMFSDVQENVHSNVKIKEEFWVDEIT